MRRSLRCPAVLSLAVACACALAGAPGAAARTPSPVLTPKPGARIVKAPVRIDVRAGREVGDLRATLNGVAIGADFARVHRSLRRLTISHSHGLRHGRNVLRVTARTGRTTRRATVRFVLGARRLLVGAGRDTRAAVGAAIRLRGVARHPRGRSGAPVRWSVVAAPRGSRLRPARRGPRAVAAQAAGTDAPALSGAASPTPTFTPDTLGSYTLQMTAGTGPSAVSDTVEVHSVHRSAVVPIDTAVDGPDPAGAVSTGSQPEAALRSGIRVGPTVYRAPFMSRDGNGQGVFTGTTEQGLEFRAAFQVLALKRRTLALDVNRTYGWCRASSGRDVFVCRSSDEGRLLRADMAAELSFLGVDDLVIAASHPTRAVPGGGWISPGGFDGARVRAGLASVGRPEREDLAIDAVAGGYALIGVPTMRPGEAQIAHRRDARARMVGHLSADESLNYGFVPGARIPFDTRSASGGAGCTGAGTCAATQTVGDANASDAVEAPSSGYLLTVYEPHTLQRVAQGTFLTGSPDAGRAMADTQNMADAIRDWTGDDGTGFVSSRGSFLVAVTSITTGSGVTAGRAVPAGNWKVLADEIAEIGGTRDRFNTAASTPGSGYTLLGWRDAEEGQARETTGAGARLRGALVPNERSEFRPVNVSADGPPAERLQQLLARPSDPAGAWPLDDDPGAQQALAAIGAAAGLSADPRSSYWLQGTRDFGSTTLTSKINGFERPAGAGYTVADVDRARARLLDEVSWVANVREYLAALSAPYDETIAEAFPASDTLADRLTAELRIAKEQAETRANWFEFVKGVLSLAGGFEGFVAEESAKVVNLVVEVSIAAMEMGSFGYESRFGGSEQEIDDDPRVRADQLAGRLRDEAKESRSALERMGNVIVSDPAKLEEVGRWGNCNGDGENGCPPGLEEYATDSATRKAATDLAKITLERTLYSDLVPRSFPVWDTGLTRDPDPGTNFDCTGADSMNSPFYDAPQLAWATSLDELDPAGRDTRRRVSILVHREKTTYSWPSGTVLRRMFAPVDLLDPGRGGLGLSAPDVLRSAESRYEPGVTCEWTR